MQSYLKRVEQWKVLKQQDRNFSGDLLIWYFFWKIELCASLTCFFYMRFNWHQMIKHRKILWPPNYLSLVILIIEKIKSIRFSLYYAKIYRKMINWKNVKFERHSNDYIWNTKMIQSTEIWIELNVSWFTREVLSRVRDGRNSMREGIREGTCVTLQIQKIERLAVACRGKISRILLLRRIIWGFRRFRCAFCLLANAKAQRTPHVQCGSDIYVYRIWNWVHNSLRLFQTISNNFEVNIRCIQDLYLQ